MEEIRNKVSEVKKDADEVKESFAQIVTQGEKIEQSVDVVKKGLSITNGPRTEENRRK
jgi:hypothetical protein